MTKATPHQIAFSDTHDRKPCLGPSQAQGARNKMAHLLDCRRPLMTVPDDILVAFAFGDADLHDQMAASLVVVEKQVQQSLDLGALMELELVRRHAADASGRRLSMASTLSWLALTYLVQHGVIPEALASAEPLAEA